MDAKMLLAVTPNGTFPVFIALTNAEVWSASCMYSDDKRMLKAPGEDRNYTMKLYREVGGSYETVVSAMNNWLNTHFGSKVVMRETRRSSDHLFRLLFESSRPTVDFSTLPD